ncbi:MAG TPA: sulfotransferase [Solirubrobacteraceae bacterium]|nr:sulfotransferase [Solirubrobacteraceae bacterium]
MRLPDFFIAGHGKSGTTAMYHMLRRHPQIYMPPGKEPWFFADELHERTPPRPGGTPTTLTEYARWFEAAAPEQRVGEATALYLWSRTAARRIAEAVPDGRIIVILREPASFLRSLHMQWVETYIETESDFAKALALEPRRREGRAIPRYTYWPQVLLYSEHVRYVEQLRRYHAVFAREQVKVLIYDDFRADNEETMRDVLRFLDVDPTVAIETVEANPTVRPRSQLLNEAVHAIGVGRGPVSRTIKEAIKAVTPAGPRREAFKAVKTKVVAAAPRPPDDALLRELRLRHKDEVQELSDYLERDLVALWGYDDLD